jgi:hypothetical protein
MQTKPWPWIRVALIAAATACGVDDRNVLLSESPDAAADSGADAHRAPDARADGHAGGGGGTGGGNTGGGNTGGTGGSYPPDGSGLPDVSEPAEVGAPDASDAQPADGSDGCVPNACGGCGTLAGAPGAACGQCGKYVCNGDNSAVTCSDPGKNACGGCGELGAAPGTSCGSCGKYACTSDNTSVACDGPGTNACGGCGTLAAAPGTACGTCGAYACSLDKSSVTCVDPGANACGGCGALAASPNTACGNCGKYVCSGDKKSVSCSDTTCGTCQKCSAPLTCTTLPLNGAGQCSSTTYCNGISNSCVTCPVPAQASELHYVDPVLGTDDATHGGAFGNCAYKTLTYALAHATGQIALATATYSPQSGETFPIVLKGNQGLLCKYTTSSPATIQGKGLYTQSYVNIAVAFEGTQNALYDCIVNGGGGTGFCMEVHSSGTSSIMSHLISGANIGNCGGVAVQVDTNFGNLSILNSTFHDSLGVFWVGTNAGGFMQNNTFSANTTDIQCQNADTGVTGSGNHRGGGNTVCVTCGNCPF